jgi:hypothetical protein
MDTANRSITQTKIHTVLQSVHVLPHTYYYRMESNHYVCQPNIRLVLVITYQII